jgi:hypothetical protein
MFDKIIMVAWGACAVVDFNAGYYWWVVGDIGMLLLWGVTFRKRIN